MIRPFCSDPNVDNFIRIREVVFGKMLSRQIKSQREDADFWLVDGFQ